MPVSSLRILVQLDFPSETVRLYEGSGPYMDGDGNIWRGAGTLTGLDAIEAALNGEAWTLELFMAGVDPQIADIAWRENEAGQVIGSAVQILTQDMDELDQPTGDPVVRFTGRIDNLRFADADEGDGLRSTIIAEVTNRFALRTATSGSVLSYIDQIARGLVLNPLAAADLFCERVSILLDHTIRWPRFTP